MSRINDEGRTVFSMNVNLSALFTCVKLPCAFEDCLKGILTNKDVNGRCIGILAFFLRKWYL